MFDLYCQPDTIYKTLSSMNKIQSGLCIPGTRLPGAFDTFEISVRAVLGQQITVKAARTLAARIVERYGKQIDTNISGLTHVFPTIKDITALKKNISSHLGRLGITTARSKTILELAKMFENENINFNSCAEPKTEIKKLMNISGIGEWTAQYIAMRAIGWPDAFLHTDCGIKKALKGYTQKQISELSEKWSPWRSYATMNLWNSL